MGGRSARAVRWRGLSVARLFAIYFGLTREREHIADEIVRRCDTVTLLTVEEVVDIRRRADTGEFDTIFEDEWKSHPRRGAESPANRGVVQRKHVRCENRGGHSV